MIERKVKAVFLSMVFLGSACFLFSCSSPTETSKEDDQPVVLTIEGVQVYPHSAKFVYTGSHGVTYYQAKNLCQSCHGQNLDGGNAKVSCQSCHKAFPHTEPFKKSFIHGVAFLKDRSQCQKCHEGDGSDKNRRVACQNCHAYPHEVLWSLPKAHGSKYKSGISECLMCHQEKSDFHKRHPDHFVSCGSCHAEIPHSFDFKYRARHTALARGYEGKCTACHEDLKKGCKHCHGKKDEIPVIQWRLPK